MEVFDQIYYDIGFNPYHQTLASYLKYIFILKSLFCHVIGVNVDTIPRSPTQEREELELILEAKKLGQSTF